MPEISNFYDIRVFINYNDHNPPHFHAEYGEYSVLICIDGWVVDGKMPKRALNLVLEWAEIHKEELLRDWYLARDKKALEKIEPLK